jgi:phosphate:Na+ symporter
VLWITALFPQYMAIITKVVGSAPGAMVLDNGVETFPMVSRGIALTHSGFNILNTLLFLPFTPQLAKLVSRLVPDKPAKEVPHLTYLDIRMLGTAAMGIQQSQAEVVKMGEHVSKMLPWVREILSSDEPNDELARKIFHREEVLDIIQKEITEFLSHLLSGNVASDVMQNARMQLRMADEYESISDYLVNILKLRLKQTKAGVAFSDEGQREILALHDRVQSYVKLIGDAVRDEHPEVLSKARVQGDAVTHEMKESREKHLSRIEKKTVTPLASLVFTDMLNAYRRVKDHGLNIAEALAGEK